MKSINNYIVEKLKISRDTNSSNKTITIRLHDFLLWFVGSDDPNIIDDIELEDCYMMPFKINGKRIRENEWSDEIVDTTRQFFDKHKNDEITIDISKGYVEDTFSYEFELDGFEFSWLHSDLYSE